MLCYAVDPSLLPREPWGGGDLALLEAGGTLMRRKNLQSSEAIRNGVCALHSHFPLPRTMCMVHVLFCPCASQRMIGHASMLHGDVTLC